MRPGSQGAVGQSRLRPFLRATTVREKTGSARSTTSRCGSQKRIAVGAQCETVGPSRREKWARHRRRGGAKTPRPATQDARRRESKMQSGNSASEEYSHTCNVLMQRRRASSVRRTAHFSSRLPSRSFLVGCWGGRTKMCANRVAKFDALCQIRRQKQHLHGVVSGLGKRNTTACSPNFCGGSRALHIPAPATPFNRRREKCVAAVSNALKGLSGDCPMISHKAQRRAPSFRRLPSRCFAVGYGIC